MTHQEINHRLTDYVLGLLAPQQANEVARHLNDCAHCRKAIREEREIDALVRQTLNIATQPDSARLRRLMPALPRQSGNNGLAAKLTTRLAPALVVMLLIAGSFLLWKPKSRRPMSLFVPATATATLTNTPTATIAQGSSSEIQYSSAVARGTRMQVPMAPVESPGPLSLVPAPSQPPTPVAALGHATAN